MSPIIAVAEPQAYTTQTGSPPTETPHQKRERLREQVRRLGRNPSEFESITGDCDAQTAQQIRDLEALLARS